MTDDLRGLAIQAALSLNWEDAIRLNNELLGQDPSNIDALNRLGFAYLKMSNLTKAKTSFEKVIKLDKYNPIARRNLDRLTSVRKGELKQVQSTSISPLQFLEEPGKTKIVDLVNCAPSNQLSQLSFGQQVFLKPKTHVIEIRDGENAYVGALPDDMSFKLLKLIEAGNEYSVHIKSISKTAVSVFIRETKRGKKMTKQPSFMTTTSYIPFSRDETITEEKPDTSATGEEEEVREEKE